MVGQGELTQASTLQVILTVDRFCSRAHCSSLKLTSCCSMKVYNYAQVLLFSD